MSDERPSKSDDAERPRTEGVRIIGAEEAARAIDRDDVVKRRGDDEPKFGDVPEPPPETAEDQKPVMRFPLPESADPSRFGAVPIVRASVEDDDEDVGSEGGSPLMPHWTDPPTGEVPEALGGDDDAAGWSLSTSTPRWRDRDEGPDEDLGDVLGESVGIQDEEDRESEDRFFTFDDLETPEEPPTMRIGTSASSTLVGPGASPQDEEAEPAAPRTGEPAERNVLMAVAVGVGLAAVALMAFVISPITAMVLVTAIIAFGSAEYFDVLQRTGRQPATLLGLAATGGLLVATYNYGYAAYPVALFLLVVFGLIWYLIGVQDEQPVENLGVTMFGVAWIGGLGSFAALMIATPGFGAEMIVAAVIATVAYDVGAFFIGRQFGKSPLSPASPNKTIEGLVGGMATSILLTILIVGLTGWSRFGGYEGLRNAALLGVAAAFMAPLGDLGQSLIKRDLGVKDMGAILPGHGGLLDRFDSLLFVLPTTYLLALVLNL